MPQDHLFAEILDAFAQLEKWIPGCGTWPVDLMIGKLPDANPADIYRLADAWGEAATRLTDYYYDVQHSADPITDNWQGDGAPMAFNMAWNQHLQDVADVAQSMGAMQMIVQNYGLELETEEFFIAFTLITLLVQAIIAIVSAFFSGGISLGGLGAAYAAARIGIKEAFEACMRALVRLGEMLATGELKKVLSRTAIKDFLKVAGRDLAGRGAAALRNAPRALGTAVKDGVKELGPRRILARAAADRAAAQFRRDIMRSVLRKELRKQLMEVGTKAEAKAAIRALDKAAAELGQRMAADLRNQLFEKFAGRTAARLGGRELAHLGEHEAFRIAEHYGERGLANTTRGMLDTFIERQLERTTMLGTAGRYVGELAFAGAKFMGGVDFGAQAFELVTGERSSIDMQEVAFSLGQGALMGGGMFGHGVLGKMVTGGFAGVATAAATDGTQLAIATIKGEKADIHWGDDMWRGARDGVRMGLVFSAPHALAGAATHVVPHFGERPGGHQTFALNDSRLGTNVWTGDTRTGAGGYTSEHGGIGWRLADGSFVHLGSDGSVIASHRAGGEPTGGGPTRDGGGSRTSVIERPTPTRSVEGGGGPRSTERALPPGHGEGGADHTQTTHTSTDRTSTVDHTQTDRTSTDHTSTDRTTTDHTTTDHTSTDRTSTDHTSTDRTQNDRTQTDHTSTGDRSDHTQTDQTQTDRTQTDRTQTDHTGADRAQTDHAETTDRDHSQTTDRTQDGDRTDRTQTTDRTQDGDRTTDRANDGDRTQTTDRTQTVDRTQTEHRPAEQPRTEVRDEQVAARHPQATHERPPARTHAEEVLARVDDTRTPEALRAEQQTHLGEPEAGRPGHTVEHVERQMQDLAVQGRESTLDGHAEPSGPGPEARMPEHPDGGTHWVSAAGGHSADPHDFPRRLFGDVLDARVPGGLAGAEPHVVREHAHELAQQIMAADAGTRRIDTVQKLREYVRSELGVTDAAGTRVDRTRVDQAADRAAEHARNRGPETDRTAGERDRQREHEPEQQRDRGPEHEGRQRDHQPERERQQEHEGQRDHEGQREHDGQQHEQQTHEPVHTPGREPVEVRFAEDPVPREHTVERRFMVFDKASGHWRLVTERATMHWNEAVFDRLPLEHMEGGIDGPAARDAAHRAAQHLAEHEYSRLVDATDRWANGEGPVEDIGKIGGMSAAVVLHDGRIVAATSMRETTHQEFHDTGYTNREWEALGARRQAEIRGDFHSTRAEADAAVMRDQVGGPRHPLVLHELNEIPRQLRSLTHGKCAEPSTLSKVARMVEADFAREVEANGGHPRPGSREYDEALRQRFHDTVRDGQMASHRNEGEPIDRSEQLPCASDDQLLGRLGLRSDYVDHAIAQAHIDPERRLVILAEEGDLLRDYGMRLPDLGPDTVVVVMHGDVDGRSITARIGGMDATGAEVARVLNRIMAEHPEQFGGDRRIVLVTCEAGVEAANAGFRGQTTSLAEQVAERTGRTVIAARGEVLVSEHGGVDTRSHQPVPDHAVDSRPRFSEPQRPGWVEVTPTHDRHGNINGARTRDLTADEAPFREHADHPVEGHQVRADQPAHGPAHPPANSAIEGTRHVPEGTRLRLNEDTAYIIAAEETHPGDFGGGVRGLVRDNGMLRVDLAGERPHYFRVEVADGMHDVSVSTVHTGQPHDPHVIRISETTDGYEVPRVWLHEITKTLDQAAPWWHQEQQPHGLMDRMAAETHAPQARSHDPYVNGRLAERNHLLRQLGDERQSWQHDELRQDLRGLDRDLAEHGHDPHRLEQVEDPTGPEHDPHDAHWNEPRWVREGRPPSIDELIPQTKAESQRWAGAIVEHVRPLFERYEFGGFHMRLEHDLPIVAHRDSLQIRLEAVRPDGGRAGHMSFTLRRLEDGTLVAHHDHLGLTDTGERGRGFYHQLNQHLEGWYRYSGVDRVELHAAESAGGYVHAREGVDWANPGAANKMLNRLQAQVDRLAGEAAAVQHFIYVDRSTQVGHLAHEYRANDAHQLYWEIERQRAAGQAVLDRAANHPYGSREFPTPKDIADAGRPLDGDTGPERMWGGKRALLGGAWMGAKHISDGGPRFTRAEQVTAGAVEHSPTFHAHARPHPEPAVVADHGHRALAGAMQRQPEHAPLRDARVELTSASPHQRDWPGNAVARSVPIDAAGRDLPHGTVPPEGGGYRIEISDRAADAAIERAVVHEVAETNEILTRHHNGEPIHVPDALRPGAHDPGARLSPHDVGRLAERSLLQHQAGDHTLSPAQREHAAHELGLLDEHLGLTGHDEATAARHALIEAHQRPADAGTGHPPANSAIEGTRHVPDGTRLRLDEHTAYVIAAEETHPGDFGGGVRGLVRDNGLLRVDLAGERPHYFRVEVADGMHDVSVSTVHTGQPHDPHVIRISEMTDGYEVPRVWLHEITKTLDQAAPWWRHEQGLVDRMGAETQTRTHDPYVNARLAERNHLLRQLGDERQSWQHDELRQDLRGLDRDLAEHGYDPHRLEQVEDPTGPAHDPHDAHWNDPRWVREGRPPSVDEVIPQTKAEAQRWSGAIAEHVRPLFERYEFGGFHMRLEHDLPVVAHRDSLQIRLEAVRPDGTTAGHMSFTMTRDEGGRLAVHHDHVAITLDGEHGRGFYRQLNQHLEGWYRYSGVDRVDLHAAAEAGGYVHAREGVDWANPGAADRMLSRLQDQVHRLARDAETVHRFIYVDRSTPIGHLAHEYRANEAFQLYHEIERQRLAGQAVLDRARTHPFGSHEFPTPKDIADAGRPLDGDTGRDRMWAGKRALLGGAWHGSKHISDGGPRFARDGEQITASSVHRSETFHGYARPRPEPAEVAHQGRQALGDALHRQAQDAPLRDARVELTSVSPERRDWPGDAVARSIPIDAAGRDLPHGTVPPEGGGYRIELSDRAADPAIERAVVHEVAETNEILARHRNGEPIDTPDALRPGAHDPDARLSPHDVGRLAERRLLQEQAGDHELSRRERASARHELELLDDHLGLTGHDEATLARRAMVEEHTSHLPPEPDRAAVPHRLDAPFRFEEMYRDPLWQHDATRFEQEVGAHFFNDARTQEAARDAVRRLRDVLTDLAVAAEPHENPAVLRERVESAFVQDGEPASAGQVGTHVRLDELLEHGNLRELMTAFYNAAYFNYKNPGTLAHSLIGVIDHDRWAAAREAGVDVAELRDVERQLDHPVRRVAEVFRPKQFFRDPFATGNVGSRSGHLARDLGELTISQKARKDRTIEAQERLGLIHTAEDYERLGVPLGVFERAFVESHVESRAEGPFTDRTPLPWREGLTAHDTTNSRWARSVAERGLLPVDGVSGTTARMLTAAKLIGLDHAQTEHFLDALMGWMLPGRDHSLFEIMRGAEVARVLHAEPAAERFEPAHMYREIPRIDPATLRAQVAPEGLVPHEARYYEHAIDPAGFSETQHKVQDIAGHLWPQLRSGHVTDPMLDHWLRENGIDPADSAAVQALADRLTEPHVMALAVYTRHSHYLINNIVRTEMFTHSDRMVEARFNAKVDQLVRNYLDNLAQDVRPLPLPLALRPVVHADTGHLTSESALGADAQRWVDARREQHEWKQRAAELRREGRIVDAEEAKLRAHDAERDRRAAELALRRQLRAVGPELLREMRWHADMVQDAMMQLPTVGTPDHPVIVFRGDWRTPVYSPIYGAEWSPHGMAREFLSTSRQLDVAVRFMSENPAAGQKVLVVFKLTGHNARDISVFSSFNTDGEVVLPPGSAIERVDDPALAAQVRSQLPEYWQDRCDIIVMTER